MPRCRRRPVRGSMSSPTSCSWLLTDPALRLVPAAASVGDLLDHQRGPGFFTMVAGTVRARQRSSCCSPATIGVAAGSGSVAIVLWIGLTYAHLCRAYRSRRTSRRSTRASTALAARGRGDAVASRCLAPCSPRTWPQPCQRRAELPRALDVAVGRHALHLDDVADLLPLHLLPRSRPATCRRRTGSTWARWRSRRWPGRC